MNQLKTRTQTAVLTTIALALSSAVALATVATGDTVGTTEQQIRAQLESKGYTIKAIEIENDEIEAEVALNGKDYEIEIDPKTGQVTEVEEDD